MDILTIAIIIFCVMELGNVLILYFRPDLKMGNGVAVFDSWRDAQKDESLNLFVHYMAYWVAGVKLIFIFLLVVVLLTGTQTTKLWAVIAMILSIITYFWRISSNVFSRLNYPSAKLSWLLKVNVIGKILQGRKFDE